MSPVRYSDSNSRAAANIRQAFEQSPRQATGYDADINCRCSPARPSGTSAPDRTRTQPTGAALEATTVSGGSELPRDEWLKARSLILTATTPQDNDHKLTCWAKANVPVLGRVRRRETASGDVPRPSARRRRRSREALQPRHHLGPNRSRHFAPRSIAAAAAS